MRVVHTVEGSANIAQRGTDQTRKRDNDWWDMVQKRWFRLSQDVSADAGGLPPRCHIATKDHASGSCFRDYAALFVGYGAFDISDRAPSLQNGALSPEPSLPDRPEEIHLQFDGSERFVWRLSACERYAHGSIRDVAKNAAVQCPHGICMLRSSS
jgi:hypothetical protein